MINTSTQLKAKVRNLSGGDSDRASILIRNYVMERFLERVSLSKYRNNFILKGGMLVAAIVGLETRATMDVDTTVKSIPLSKGNARRIVDDIIAVAVPDGMSFVIMKEKDIMEEHDYPGIRFMLEAKLDKLRQPFKIDISTGDIITPSAIEYSYKLMFEERTIAIWTYNLETVLAEKLETIMAKEIANTRMRDFYDIYILTEQKDIKYRTLHDAFMATSKQRNTVNRISDFDSILAAVRNDEAMRDLWDRYSADNFFVESLTWDDVNDSVRNLVEKSVLAFECHEI